MHMMYGALRRRRWHFHSRIECLLLLRNLLLVAKILFGIERKEIPLQRFDTMKSPSFPTHPPLPPLPPLLKTPEINSPGVTYYERIRIYSWILSSSFFFLIYLFNVFKPFFSLLFFFACMFVWFIWRGWGRRRRSRRRRSRSEKDAIRPGIRFIRRLRWGDKRFCAPTIPFWLCPLFFSPSLSHRMIDVFGEKRERRGKKKTWHTLTHTHTHSHT